MKYKCETDGQWCESLIRELLPEMGFRHRKGSIQGGDSFWWASRYEDRVFGLDCWLYFEELASYEEIAVDFTVISDEDLIPEKMERALSRGIIPVFLEREVLIRAQDGSHRAIDGLNRDLRVQVSVRLKALKERGVKPLTRQELAERGRGSL